MSEVLPSTLPAGEMSAPACTRSGPARHLNKLRWVSLSLVFALLIVLPFIAVYQTQVAAHAYDLLSPGEQHLYDFIETLTAPFASDPERNLDAVKGTTWSGTFFGWKLSDPLAALGQSAAALGLYWPFLLSALIPVIVTLALGRVYCGWICPATFLYEINTNLGVWLHKAGFAVGNRRFDRRWKYLVLGMGLVLSAATGAVLVAGVYPPAVSGARSTTRWRSAGSARARCSLQARCCSTCWSQGAAFAATCARAARCTLCWDVIA